MVAFVLFGLGLVKTGKHTTSEQKWILLLLALLVLYNDPFIAAEVDSGTPIFSAFAVLFDVTFVSAMLSFWLVMIDNIRYSDTPRDKRPTRLAFWLPKAVLMTSFWFSTVTVYMWTKMQQIGDPVHNEPDDLKHFVFLKMLSFLILGLYLIWLIYLIVRCLPFLRRLRLSFVFFFALTGFVALVVGIGLAVGAYAPLPAEKGNFLPFLTLSNLYVCTLAWAWQTSDSLADANSLELVGGDPDQDAQGGIGHHLVESEDPEEAELGPREDEERQAAEA